MHRDHWAKKAKLDGFRSRAVYKIIEIDQKVDLIHQTNCQNKLL